MKKKIEDALAIIVVFAVLVGGILAVAIQLDNYRRAKGLTHYDRVQMDRLVNSL